VSVPSTADGFEVSATRSWPKSAPVVLANIARWIRSYVVKDADGRLGSFCVYEARDPESIREHARRVGMPGDQIFPFVNTIVIRDDPHKREAA
jgi:Protein of unknown function (DUF4242)